MGSCLNEKRKTIKIIENKNDSKSHEYTKALENGPLRLCNSTTNTPSKKILEFEAQITSAFYPKEESVCMTPSAKHKDKNLLKNQEFKIVIYGPPETGKSTFGLKLTNNKICSFYIPSVFNEIFKTQIILNRQLFQFEIVIPNLEEQNSLIEANCYFIFFDISTNKSLIEAKNITHKLLKKRKEPIIFVGNKCDLCNSKEITNSEIKKICKKENHYFAKISAFEGIGLNKLMSLTGEKLIKKKKT